SSVPTTLPTAYDVYPLDGRHDGGYYTVKDCVTIDVLPRTPGNNVYVGFMVWSNFTAKIGRAVQQECRDRSRMPSSAWKKKTPTTIAANQIVNGRLSTYVIIQSTTT